MYCKYKIFFIVTNSDQAIIVEIHDFLYLGSQLSYGMMKGQYRSQYFEYTHAYKYNSGHHFYSLRGISLYYLAIPGY